jgi:parvulin-like peptidyl-prolyl isomerase
MNQLRTNLTLVVISFFIGSLSSLNAQESVPDFDKDDPSVVLAYQGTAVITQQEVDAAFSRIPEKDRLLFIRDGARVDQLVKGLLEIEMLANDARANGLMDDPIVASLVAMAAEKELAQAWSQRIPDLAPEADFETLAYEDYLANPRDYDKTATIDITQILLATRERTLEEAEELAFQLKAQLDEQPDLFQKFVAQYSDDESKITTFGRLEGVTKGQMVKPFEAVAFALTNEGEISEPVVTRYGVHLIRLDAINGAGVPPFEEVKAFAIEKQKREYQQAYLRKYLSKLFTTPVVFPEGSIEIMAKRHFGENLEKAPIYTEDLSE